VGVVILAQGVVAALRDSDQRALRAGGAWFC
jgi:hypothetical protein